MMALLQSFLTCWVFCRVKKISFPAMLDVLSFGILIGQILGRWGNFFNREAFGAETDIFCRMGLISPDGSVIYVHPTFLYESLWNLLGFLLLHFHSKKYRRWQGQYFLFYLIWYGFGRALPANAEAEAKTETEAESETETEAESESESESESEDETP